MDGCCVVESDKYFLPRSSEQNTGCRRALIAMLSKDTRSYFGQLSASVKDVEVNGIFEAVLATSLIGEEDDLKLRISFFNMFWRMFSS